MQTEAASNWDNANAHCHSIGGDSGRLASIYRLVNKIISSLIHVLLFLRSVTQICYPPHKKYRGRHCFHRRVSFILSTGGGYLVRGDGGRLVRGWASVRGEGV